MLKSDNKENCSELDSACQELKNCDTVNKSKFIVDCNNECSTLPNSNLNSLNNSYKQDKSSLKNTNSKKCNMVQKLKNQIKDSESYDSIQTTRNVHYHTIIKALEITAEYIQRNNLILCGGMAIDLCLKLKNANLYQDYVLPDYDFYSTDFHADAYNIAKEMIRAGMPNVDVINARHTSTMRVRVNSIVVADCTYVPKIIFDVLPTIKYKKFIVIHPYYQIIDQHRALAIPFENPPMETIMGSRWKKDMKRHNLLVSYFPLEALPKKINRKFYEYEIEHKEITNSCIGGFAGLAYWAINAMQSGLDIPDLYEEFIQCRIDMSGIKCKIPTESFGISFYYEDQKLIDKLAQSQANKLDKKARIKAIKQMDDIKNKKTSKSKSEINADKNKQLYKKRYFNPILDKIPAKTIIEFNSKHGPIEFLDNGNNMLSAKLIHEQNNIYVANLQAVLTYMLTYYIIKGDACFYLGYKLGELIVNWATENYDHWQKNNGEDQLNNPFAKFLPSVETYGTNNESDSYKFSHYKLKYIFKIINKDNNILPKKVYPSSIEDIKDGYYKFRPKDSPLFQFDGQETDKPHSIL